MNQRVLIQQQDIADLDDVVHALFRAREHTLAIRMGALVLRLRGQVQPEFRCHIDESAGLAEVVELHKYSRGVPCS